MSCVLYIHSAIVLTDTADSEHHEGMKRRVYTGALLLGCLVAILVSPPAAADEYVPPPEPEQPLLDFELKPANQVPGIIISALGVGGGITMVVVGLVVSVRAVPDGLDSPGFQGGLMTAAGGVVVSALMSLGLDYFTVSIRERRLSRRLESR
jgi:hypothetical protein